MRQTLLDYSSFYLVGIKGVAMTSLAQCLVDANKKVRGSDVEEIFVTQPLLDANKITIDETFNTALPEDIDCVVYTGAHQADHNPQVKAALTQGIATFSQAEALADLFNTKQGIAVCGVGGKSTTSAMISWILQRVYDQNPDQMLPPSFSVGVGNIPNLNRTGQWKVESKFFVAEADEYVINPHATSLNQTLIPRFSFLKPWLTVCTNISFDHPDVYRDLDHTISTFAKFFSQLKPSGKLIINGDDPHLRSALAQLKSLLPNLPDIISVGENTSNQVHLIQYHSQLGKTTTVFSFNNIRYTLELSIPGKYNAMNALLAIAAATEAGVSIDHCLTALQQFRSTKRRFEYIGSKNGVIYYDDYAHHPQEIKLAIQAINEWYPQQKIIVAFQPHTFSRTKQLFSQFIDAFSQAKDVVLLDIFASAREANDPTISSDQLVTAIKEKFPQVNIQNLHTIAQLAKYCQSLTKQSVLITLGAGDIYQVHELLD